jgi:hypothetical protein
MFCSALAWQLNNVNEKLESAIIGESTTGRSQREYREPERHIDERVQ